MRYVVFNEQRQVLTRMQQGVLRLPESAEGLRDALLISEDVTAGYAGDLPDSFGELAGLEWKDLRQAGAQLEREEARLAAKGIELLEWHAGCKYCSRCGEEMRAETAISRKCPECGREVFAPVSAAVLVLILKDDRALLVHAKTFSRPFYGLVAGFVETGESLEECVRREVREETSLEIEDIRYFGSQPWPFPANLMIGFTARWKSGEIRFADGELTEGGFFSRDALPQLPTPPSLARTLIDAWVAGELKSGPTR